MIAALVVLQLTATAPQLPGLILTRVSVIDGDTIHEGKRTQDYRVFGIDAPETARAKCEVEKVLGQVAAARVAALVEAAGEVLAFPAWDPRGRTDWPTDGFDRRIARIEIDGRDLAEILLAEGLAKPYDGRGEHPDWCTP